MLDSLPFACAVEEPPHDILLVVAVDPHCIPALELGAADWLEELFQLTPPPVLLLLSPPQLIPPDDGLVLVPPQLTPALLLEFNVLVQPTHI